MANSIAEKWKNMEKDKQMIKEILQNPAELKMTTRDWKKHDSAHKCHICNGILQDVRYNKAKYYENETQVFIGAAHHGCVRTVCDARRINYKKSLYRTEKLSAKEKNCYNIIYKIRHL